MTNSDFRAGSRIGGYILDSYIGGGSFGAVWRGHAEGSEQPVAIKLLTGALAAGDNTAMRADVELLAAAAASRSAHVVRVLGGGVDPVSFIVMELIEGSDLQGLLQSQGRLTPARTVEIGLALTDALLALNQVGIIHRDIKPANVMIDQDGVIKLADFGIAKIVGYSGMTMTGQTAMTMAYAAPEVWDEGSAFGRPSHRTDLYAMGVLLYQCLVGIPPFVGNYGALYKAHTAQPPDLDALPADSPPSLRILIARCLEKRQDERPHDAAVCEALLTRAQVELAEAAGKLSTEPRKLGPWLRDAPHPSVPWAWRCHHERTGEFATVELIFADSLDTGDRLTRAVAANAMLTPLGAERLIDSNRLLLYPGESWQAAPASEFQFWVAREDRKVAAARSTNDAALRTAVPAIARLIEAAAVQGIPLDVGHDNLTVSDSGAIYVRRPGLSLPAGDAESAALNALAVLPMDERPRRLVDGANSFRGLVATLSPLADSTATVIAGGAEATQLAQRLRPAASQQVAPPIVVAPPRGMQPPPPPPVQPPYATAGGGKRSGPPVLAMAAGLGALAAIAIGAVVFASSGKSDNNGVSPTPPAGNVVAPQATRRTPPTRPPAATSVPSTATSPAVVPTRPPATTVPVTATQPAPTATQPAATATTAAPALPTRTEILAAIDKSNQVYISAFRNGDIAALGTVFSGEALTYYQTEMRKMLAANQRQDNALLQSDTQDVQIVDATHASAKTRERWSYKVVGSATPALITTYDESYELVKTGNVWLVSVNTFQKVP